MNGEIGMCAPVTANQNAKMQKCPKKKKGQRERNVDLNNSKGSTGCNGFAGTVSTHAKSLI
jgi:hypothetical protein